MLLFLISDTSTLKQSNALWPRFQTHSQGQIAQPLKFFEEGGGGEEEGQRCEKIYPSH